MVLVKLHHRAATPSFRSAILTLMQKAKSIPNLDTFPYYEKGTERFVLERYCKQFRSSTGRTQAVARLKDLTPQSSASIINPAIRPNPCTTDTSVKFPVKRWRAASTAYAKGLNLPIVRSASGANVKGGNLSTFLWTALPCPAVDIHNSVGEQPNAEPREAT